MELLTFSVAAIVIILIAVSNYLRCQKTFERRHQRTPQKFAGPTIIETLYGFIKDRHHIYILLTKWAAKYGPLYSIFIGTERYFILNDVTLLKKTFSRLECSGRPKLTTLDPFYTGTIGIINAEGKEGQDHRNFVVSTLRHLGLGRVEVTELFMDEVHRVLKTLEENQGEVFFVRKKFLVPVLNALWITVANRRLHPSEDAEGIETLCSLAETGEQVATNPAIIFSERVAKLVPWWPSWKRYRKAYQKTTFYLQKVIDEHKESFSSGEPRDFIDAYLQKVDSEIGDDASIFKNGKYLIDILIDLFVAGSETSSVMMEWLILYMVRYPLVQKRLRKDLLRVVGSERLPKLTDRLNLPAIDATIYEVLRLSPVAATGVPHKILEDFELDPNNILPKGSNLLLNIYMLQRDPRVWENPNKFHPDRFLNQDGKLMRPVCENFVPFSNGKRRCIGRYLAMDTLFLLFSGIFHKFELEAHPHFPIPTLEPAGGLGLVPSDFPIFIKPIH